VRLHVYFNQLPFYCQSLYLQPGTGRELFFIEGIPETGHFNKFNHIGGLNVFSKYIIIGVALVLQYFFKVVVTVFHLLGHITAGNNQSCVVHGNGAGYFKIVANFHRM
jgi:hypothetical protein